MINIHLTDKIESILVSARDTCKNDNIASQFKGRTLLAIATPIGTTLRASAIYKETAWECFDKIFHSQDAINNSWLNISKKTFQATLLVISSIFLLPISFFAPNKVSHFIEFYNVISRETPPTYLKRLSQICQTNLNSLSKVWPKIRPTPKTAGIIGGLALTILSIGAVAWYRSQQTLERQFTMGTTYIKGNPLRDSLSEMVAGNHEEYAQRWGMNHELETTNLLKNACSKNAFSSEQIDCEPYWNKVAILRRWLHNPEKDSREQWYIMADDDMPVTNMNVNPSTAIDALRGLTDSSIIIAKDVMNWHSNADTAVNTGLMIVRKDDTSKTFFDNLWERRNSYVGLHNCPTLGVCKEQKSLHEQNAFADLLDENPSLMNGAISVVEPRNSNHSPHLLASLLGKVIRLLNSDSSASLLAKLGGRAKIALNTFHRNGCFIRQEPDWENRVHYNDSHEGTWRKGDWMGQTAGVPVWGWWCGDKDSKPPGHIRKDMLQHLFDNTIRA